MKKTLKNKKGGAVINTLMVILFIAIMVFAISQFINYRKLDKRMEDANYNGLLADANTIIKVIQAEMSIDIVDNGSDTGNKCIPISYFIDNGYLIDLDADKYTGSLSVKCNNNNKCIYKVWISNGKIALNGVTQDNISRDSIVQKDKVSNNCGV